jgi:hypothetical protein
MYHEDRKVERGRTFDLDKILPTSIKHLPKRQIDLKDIQIAMHKASKFHT